VATQAPAQQDQPLAVDVVALDDAVDHGLDDPLPGRRQRRAVLDEELALPGTVDEHDVIAAGQRLQAHGQVHVRDAGVVALP
jgi:hypothetical protein